MKVSIIVPVYNAARYLQKCLESCFAQTYQDIEIVCIDDGSTDNSREILQSYRKRIVLFCQSNQGVVTARRRGIEAATGEYCYFLDSDDWIPSTAISDLVAVLDDETDIAFGGQTLVRGDNATYRSLFPLSDMPGKKYVNVSLRCGNGYIGGKMFRTKLCQSLEIDSSYKLNEDLLMNMQLGLLARRVKYVEKNNYFYFWDLAIDRVKCPPLESVMSVLNVNRDVALMLKEKAAYIYHDGYIDYLVRNAKGALSSPIFTSEYRFYRDELRYFAKSDGVKLWQTISQSGIWGWPLIFGIISWRLARGITQQLLLASRIKRKILR